MNRNDRLSSGSRQLHVGVCGGEAVMNRNNRLSSGSRQLHVGVWGGEGGGGGRRS